MCGFRDIFCGKTNELVGSFHFWLKEGSRFLKLRLFFSEFLSFRSLLFLFWPLFCYLYDAMYDNLSKTKQKKHIYILTYNIRTYIYPLLRVKPSPWFTSPSKIKFGRPFPFLWQVRPTPRKSRRNDLCRNSMKFFSKDFLGIWRWPHRQSFLESSRAGKPVNPKPKVSHRRNPPGFFLNHECRNLDSNSVEKSPGDSHTFRLEVYLTMLEGFLTCYTSQGTGFLFNNSLLLYPLLGRPRKTFVGCFSFFLNHQQYVGDYYTTLCYIGFIITKL